MMVFVFYELFVVGWSLDEVCDLDYGCFVVSYIFDIVFRSYVFFNGCFLFWIVIDKWYIYIIFICYVVIYFEIWWILIWFNIDNVVVIVIC